MLATIKVGSSGNVVKIAQYLMGAASRKKATGKYVSSNTSFVKSWQSKHGLAADGIIGKDTWTAIAKAAPTCSTSKNTTSAATCALQLVLDAGLDADGIFGSKTKKAVAAYQSSIGLSADGICGPKTWNALITGVKASSGGTSTPSTPSTPTTSGGGKFIQPVDYKQGDSRWGKKMYSNHNDKSQTMSNSGCGPTAMANIVATWVDKSITPYTLAQLAMKWGDRTANSGTAWSFFSHIQSQYKFSKMVQTTSLSTMKACLDAGGYVVCSMGPGYWTKGGHFITAWKYDGTYIYCNDPASSSRKKQKESQFNKERKAYFCFYK